MEYSLYTNKGCRENNEDSCNIARYNDSFCFVVADGLGGHGGGEIASKTAVDSVCSLFCEEGYSDTFFKKAFHLAQQNIFEEQKKVYMLSQMKTTLVILVIEPQMIYWAHVGDSRMYYLKNNRIKLRTLDHSVPQVMATSGQIKNDDIRHHPDRNRLLQVMGVKGQEAQFEISPPLKAAGKQTFLLCTDGFWELIIEKDMQKCLKESNSPEEWLQKMAEMIEKNGEGTNMDNYTAIAVSIKNKGFFGF